MVELIFSHLCTLAPLLFGTSVIWNLWFLAPEVAAVIFSDSDSAPVPKFLNPGPDPDPAILQVWESDSYSDSGTVIDPTVIHPCFSLEMTAQSPATAETEKWLRIRFPFFTNFWLRARIRHRKKNAESCRFRPNLFLALLLFGSVNDEPYWILLEMARAAMVRVLGGPQRLNERGGDDIFSVWTSPSRPLLLKETFKILLS